LTRFGRPLPNRRNIVITRDADWRRDGVEAVASLAAAAALVGDIEAFVIGGAQIYAEAMPHAERLIVTEIGKKFGCDAYFPQINPQQWKEVARDAYYSEQNGCGLRIRYLHPQVIRIKLRTLILRQQ